MENNAAFNKVARITLYFWIMKVLSTTLGEVLGDFCSMTLNAGYVVSLAITAVFFLTALIIQLKASRFYSWLYWLTIVGSTTVGTEISDLMDRTLGLGYALGSLILFCCLITSLIAWHIKESKIVVYPVTKLRV
ncbi:MAG: hypothetical protein JWM28_1892, partial [Chitinophagaceae bacterium]|nr:hypothetical protein [Chitinophagaceae bacterium]